jgi:hypothetical protein
VKMRVPRWAVVLVGLFAVVGWLVVAGVWWASVQPKEAPANLQGKPVWAVNPMPRFAHFPANLLAPRGMWVSCWLDARRNIDTCEFAGFNGRVWYRGDYTTCDGRPPLPDAGLFPVDFHQSVGFVSLLDGRVLSPVDDCPAKGRGGSPTAGQPYPK